MSLFPSRAILRNVHEQLGAEYERRRAESDPVVHWMAHESTLVWNSAITAIACGVQGASDHNLTKVTCPDCLNVVMRRRCLALEDAPGPLPSRCTLRPHGIGLAHSWEVLTSPLTDQERAQALDTPSGVLPRRTPGAALGDAEAESGAAHAENAARGSESILGHPIIERWPA